MNLPLTQGNFGVVEEVVVGKAEVTATALAMKEACQEEIYLTLNVHERGDWATDKVLLVLTACLY
jgi:hypothetical protein